MAKKSLAKRSKVIYTQKVLAVGVVITLLPHIFNTVITHCPTDVLRHLFPVIRPGYEDDVRMANIFELIIMAVGTFLIAYSARKLIKNTVVRPFVFVFMFFVVGIFSFWYWFMTMFTKCFVW